MMPTPGIPSYRGWCRDTRYCVMQCVSRKCGRQVPCQSSTMTGNTWRMQKERKLVCFTTLNDLEVDILVMLCHTQIVAHVYDMLCRTEIASQCS